MSSPQLKWFILENKLHYRNQSANETFDKHLKLLSLEQFGLNTAGFQFFAAPTPTYYSSYFTLLPEKQNPEETHSQSGFESSHTDLLKNDCDAVLFSVHI